MVLCYRTRNWSILLIPLALLALIWSGCSDDDDGSPKADAGIDAAPADGAEPDISPATSYELLILHTSDLHAHLMGRGPIVDYSPATTNDDATMGGFARLAALIKNERAAAGTRPVLLLDGGDFMMGSLFTWLGLSKAPTPTLMQTMGYDAMTLGNHEFEWSSEGLAGILGAAIQGGFEVPIVASNLTFDDQSSADDLLETLVKAGNIKTKLVKTMDNGLKVGLFGILGKGASRVAPAAKPIEFEDAVQAAQAVVTDLKDNDKVDLIIGLSHSGVNDEGEGEDRDLAEAVPEIDVIISGHKHTAMEQPLKVGNTLIVMTGRDSEHLGKLELTIKDGAVQSSTYTLLDVDDTIEGDSEVQATIDGYIAELDTLLEPHDLSYGKVMAETAFDLTDPRFQETQLGDLVTDAYLSTYNALHPDEPADLTVEAHGIIRDELLKGETGQLTLADLMRSVPLGIGPDNKPGYPLVEFYITGKEIKAGLELLYLSESPLLNSASYFLQVGGVQMEYNKSGPLFNSVTSASVGDPPQAVDLADTTKCYKMVTSLYVAKMLGVVGTATSGVLSVEAKQKDCQTVIADVTTRIIDADPTTSGVQELKQWQAFVQYVSSLPDADADGIPDIPSAYSQPQNRIVAK